MHEHLKALILSHIERHVLIYRLCLARGEIIDHDVHRLFVLLSELWL